MNTYQDDYDKAADYISKNIMVTKPGSDPAVWNLNNALSHLVKAIQQDMRELKTHLDAVSSELEAMKRRLPQ